MTPPAIETENLTDVAGDETLVDDVSVSNTPGEILVIVGPSGGWKPLDSSAAQSV